MMSAATRFRKSSNILLIACLGLLAGCAKEKDTLSARIYHSTTSFFNGYYNAEVLFGEFQTKLESQYKYPEQGFIEVLRYGTEDEIKALKADLQNVIKKNDAVIFKHPNGNYIDDCRLLNGKSWLYQREYDAAELNFKYVIEKFPESKLIPEAWFGLAQVHYRNENPEMSRNILDEVLLSSDTFEISPELQGEMALFRVRLELDRKAYAEAAAILQEQLPNIRQDLRQARAHYLLGQLYSELGDYPKALEQFTEVSNFREYTLAFSAKMKIARLYVTFQEGQDDDRTVFDYLTKLLRDEKNLEYQDQIYYEFALLELKKANRPEALAYLRKSLRASTGNTRQKALSYFKAGQIYFYDLQNYPSAQAYYDSAAAVITPDAPEYKEIKSLAATLEEYILHKTTIAYQDSMLRLARLPQAELDSVISRVAEAEKQRREAEAERLLQASQTPSDPMFNPQLALQNGGGGRQSANSGGQWYFDNPSAISSGRLQFQQVWGKRANEDHWRRSRKQAMAEAETGEGKPEAAPVDSALLKQYGDRYQYLKDIPRTPEEIETAQQKIEMALYGLGQLYSQKLNEPDSAIQTFETLLDRFENTEFALRTRYALYTLYQAQDDPRQFVHRSYILSEHPNSVYAYLIEGRDLRELRRDEEDYAFAYEGLYRAYNSRQYETTIGFGEFLLQQQQFASNPEIELAELHYMRGMAYGYLGNQDSLRQILTYVVSTFPESDVVPRARKTLGYLQNGLPTASARPAAGTDPAATAVSADDARFKGFLPQPAPGDKVFVLMYVDKNRLSKDDASALLSDFHQKNFKESRLKVFVFLYKQTHLLPYISTFGTIDEGKRYIQQLQADPIAKTLMPEPKQDRVFYITHSNFKIAYGEKRMEDYLLYFDQVLSAAKP
ncbi:MAG: tetratricopeptide repeat protein [Bacteroidia bacterium]|nr:tetratricopeptide repeat protein [Bacteroidia bacterium]